MIEEGGFVEKVQKLLGLGIAAQGPEARAGSAGKDQRIGVVGRWHYAAKSGGLFR